MRCTGALFHGEIWVDFPSCGDFLKWWYPTTMDFPTKIDHFGVFLGVPPFKETPIYTLQCLVSSSFLRQSTHEFFALASKIVLKV